MLLAPCGFVAATVHAPIGAHSGVPVPLGFASFDPRIVDRAMAMLAGQAPRIGLDEALSRELISTAAEPQSTDPETRIRTRRCGLWEASSILDLSRRWPSKRWI